MPDSPRLQIPGLSWIDDAPCLSAPELFSSQGPYAQARAKKLCGGCPHKQLCLDNALAMEDDWGVWGGTDPEERRRLRPRAGVNHLPPVSPRRSA